MSDDFRKNRQGKPLKKPQKLDSLRSSLKGGQKEESLFAMWQEQEEQAVASKKAEAKYQQAKKALRQSRKEVWSEYFDVATLEKRLKSLLSSVHEYSRTLFSWVGRQNRFAVVFVAIFVLAGGVALLRSSTGPQTLGDTTGQPSLTTPDIPTDLSRESLDFALLYPSSSDASLYSVAKVSPDGTAPAYAFLDRFTADGTVFRVTQQQVPSSFDLNQAAEDFQATNVIQVDDSKIYHGYSEKGRIQSLLFVKEDLLVLIRSSERFSDDQWAAYYLSLEK